MAVPQNKEELINFSEDSFKKLNELIDTFGDHINDIFDIEDSRDKNIRDVLAHIHEWHNMLYLWYTVGMKGDKPVTPKEGYTWKEIPKLNLEIWNNYQETTLKEIREEINFSHKRLIGIMNKHTYEELFTKSYYKWTNTSNLSTYFRGSGFSHYEWGIKKVKQFKKMI